MSVRIEHGDCLDVMAKMAADSVDAIVTDPPYGLGFMGKAWDAPGSFVERKAEKRNTFDHVGGNHNASNSADAARTRAVEGRKFQTWCEEWAREAFRVLKPGGHLVAFGGTRTYHRLACAIEDAGFEIRDQLAWTYGTGFPKSQNVSKAIDKAAGATREVIEEGPTVRRIRPGADQGKDGTWEKLEDRTYTHAKTAPATPEAAQWEGWGTALKPAWEPICLARKPLIGTVAANVRQFGTGAINIDGCRVETDDALGGGDQSAKTKIKSEGWDRPWMQSEVAKAAHADRVNANVAKAEALGRWPADLIHDGSEEVLACFPDTVSVGHTPARRGAAGMWSGEGGGLNGNYGSDTKHGTGSAARFFFSSKAGADDRCDSKHPTIKPVALMRWLARLVTPPGGLVLDPFAGSGTTGVACLREGFGCILIEREDQYVADIRHRIAKLSGLDTPLFAMAPP